ncbi:hypothetical protein QTP88_011955 [Uroleucon formosanum]
MDNYKFLKYCVFDKNFIEIKTVLEKLSISSEANTVTRNRAFQLSSATSNCTFLINLENLHKSVNENLDFQEQDPIKLNEDDDASNVGLAEELEHLHKPVNENLDGQNSYLVLAGNY